jgi:hypothetical protein
MPNPTRARAAIVFAAALVAVTCSFPDDQSADVYVVVTQDPELQAQGVLGEGETRLLSARAFRKVGAAINPTADVEIHNIEFFWFSDNENIATVRGGAAGGVDVTGEGPGVVAIRARPKQFEGAEQGTTVLRVASLYEVDSVRPSGVRYGEKVTLFGVRMHLTLGAALSGEELIVDPFSFAGNRDGLGRIELWVPPRATSARLTFIGPGAVLARGQRRSPRWTGTSPIPPCRRGSTSTERAGSRPSARSSPCSTIRHSSMSP